MSNSIYDEETKVWFSKNIGNQITVYKCDKCGLFYKQSLGHKCKKEGKSDGR